MAYLDLEDQQTTPESEAEARRKVLGMIAGAGKKPVLGAPQPDQPPPQLASAPSGPTATALPPGSRDYDLAVSATNQPRIPTRNVSPLTPTPPAFDTPPTSRGTVLGGGTSGPMRPNVAPSREDYPAKPEVGGWKKYLGLGLAALSGPQTAGPLAEKILHGQRDVAERKYGQAEQEWESGQADQTRQAQIRNINSEIETRENPKPEKQGLTPEETTIHDLMTGSNGGPRLNPDTKQPYSYLDAYSAVQGAKQGAKPEKTPSFDEATYQEWLKTNPGGTRLQFKKALSTATEKPEKPQRTLVTVPQPDGSAKVMEATPGMTIPKGARTVTEFGKDQAPTADEQRRADLGNNLNENLNAYEEIVRKRPDLFGPIAGRKTALLMATGSSDQDIAALRSIKEFAGMAAVGTHAMRNAQHVKIASDAMMNLNDRPEAILAEKGPLSRARTSIQTFIGDVQGQRVQDKAAQGATVNVIAPDGTPGTIPRANLQKALKAGYRQQ